MIFFVTSLLALFLAPLIYHVVRERQNVLTLLDGFIFTSMSGLILLVIVPGELAEAGGWWIVIFLLLGLMGPTLLEKNFRRASRSSHNLALVMAMIFLAVHAVVDGAALVDSGDTLESVHDHSHHDHLSSAILLHRLPVGLTVWWLLRPQYGAKIAIGVLSGMALSTAVGYGWGHALIERLSGQGMAWFQALVAGSLLHVVFHRPHVGGESGCHDHSHSHGHADRKESRLWWEGFGGALGIVLGISLMAENFVGHEDADEAGVAQVFLGLALESAPALLLGFLMAGLVSTLLPRSSLSWLGKGSTVTQAARGVVIGLPIPICSCGVVPLYRSLIQQGAPAPAAMAFLVATPELGLDAILLSIPLLGGWMTFVRVASAFLVALLVGWLVGRCTSIAGVSTGDDAAGSTGSRLPQKLSAGVRLGFGEILDHTAPWILLGLGIAALCSPLMSEGWLASIPVGIDVLLFAFLGVPTYVCASGATPFVAVLLASGVSPGAALAFLLTGPATNVTTFGVLARLHGRRTALFFSFVMVTGSILLGFLASWLLPDLNVPSVPVAESASSLQWICLYLLAGVFGLSMLRRGPRKFAAEIYSFDESVPHVHATRL